MNSPALMGSDDLISKVVKIFDEKYLSEHKEQISFKNIVKSHLVLKLSSKMSSKQTTRTSKELLME